MHALDHLAGDPARNIVVARVSGGVEAHLEALTRATREFYATSACGICGKTSIDRVSALVPDHPPTERVPTDAVMATLPERVVGPGFRATGGLHAAALVDYDGALEVLREDIGRHNAVDKVIGWRLRQDRLPIRDRVLVVSGRTGFEIVQKAAMVGVPVICGVGAASTLAVELARRSGMALFGFVREGRWTRYC